jgi:FkbM family methyltransferase
MVGGSIYGRLLHAVIARAPVTVLNRLGKWEYEHPLFRRLARRFMQPMQAADTIISQGVGEGLRFRSAGGFPGRAIGMIEPEVQEALRDLIRPRDTFYDVGANIGFFTLLGARLVGPDGRVVAIEPQPEALAGLRHNVRINRFGNVTVVEAAIADSPGESEFHISHEGILEWGALGPGDDNVPTIRVRVTSLDHLVLEERLTPPSVLKLDIEGAEVRALRGMEETMRRHRPRIVCEIHTTLDDVVTLLEQHGYAVDVLAGNGKTGEEYYGQVVATPG